MNAPNEQVFEDRYTVLEKIGAGRQGVVLKVQRYDGRLFAAKKLNAPDVKTIEAFERDFQLRKTLDHPGIVKAEECFSWQDPRFSEFSFISVMELVDGKSLAEYMHEGMRVNEEGLVNIRDQTLEALAEAHSKGVVHRDLKPSNIMLTHDRQVKVTDFELAKILGNETRLSSAGKGSLAYMAPEQLKGGQITPETDYCGLGLTLIALARGTEPHTDMLSLDPRMYLKKMPHLSDELKNSLECLIDKDPMKRMVWRDGPEPKKRGSGVYTKIGAAIGTVIGIGAAGATVYILGIPLSVEAIGLLFSSICVGGIAGTQVGQHIDRDKDLKEIAQYIDTLGKSMEAAASRLALSDPRPNDRVLFGLQDLKALAEGYGRDPKHDFHALMAAFGYKDVPNDPDGENAVELKLAPFSLAMQLSEAEGQLARRLTRSLCEYVPWLDEQGVLTREDAATNILKCLEFKPFAILNKRYENFRRLAHPDYAIVYTTFREEVELYSRRSGISEENALIRIMDAVRKIDESMLLNEQTEIQIRDYIHNRMINTPPASPQEALHDLFGGAGVFGVPLSELEGASLKGLPPHKEAVSDRFSGESRYQGTENDTIVDEGPTVQMDYARREDEGGPLFIKQMSPYLGDFQDQPFKKK